jgi:hypothetical protein
MKINVRRPQENGDVEQSHYRFIKALDQELVLRGSRDFRDRTEYNNFLAKMFKRRNLGRQERFQEELARLRMLPKRRLESYKELTVKVYKSGTIRVAHNIYSVNSRLRDERLRVRLYAEHLDLFLGQKHIERLSRLRGSDKAHIQYRHIIHTLVRKPGAFADYRYRDFMFPSTQFRQAYDWLKRKHSDLCADREYLRILFLAATEGEALVEHALIRLLDRDTSITERAVKDFLASGQGKSTPTEIKISPVDLSCYDGLFSSAGGPDGC